MKIEYNNQEKKCLEMQNLIELLPEGILFMKNSGENVELYNQTLLELFD